jgi:Spy/CpxP family protein refolding chaperone
MVRKHIVVLGAALVLMAAGETAAQSSTPSDTLRRQGEMRRGQRARGAKVHRGAFRVLFRGIELTQAQRDQMKTVNEKYRSQSQTLRESLKPDLKAAHDARHSGDTAAARAAWERTSAGRERLRALMEQQRNEIRSLLTPEQQQTFDRNAQKMRERMEKRGARKAGKRS